MQGITEDINCIYQNKVRLVRSTLITMFRVISR
nr:MAG TPA: hypothetical protein [Caudoviricetes sp.]